MSSTTKSNTDSSDNSSDNKDDKKFSIKDTLYSVFNQSNILILIWFLAIYLIIYIILAIFKKPSPEGNGLLSSRMFDIIVFGIIGCILIYNLLYQSGQEKEKDFKSIFSSVVCLTNCNNNI